MGIEGLDSLINKLNRLANSREVLKKSMETVVKKVQGDAKELAPVDQGQLRNTIYTKVEENSKEITGIVYTPTKYAAYVEFGTGPVGRDSPKDLPQGVDIQYRNDMWWIHESQIDPATAAKYHFIRIETEKGVFYGTRGQAPQPFMYPALKQNKETILEMMAADIRMEFKKKGD